MSLFKVADVLQPSEFAQKIKAGATNISQFVSGALSDASRAGLAQWGPANPVPPDLLRSLVDDLNRIILGVSIWDANRFAGVVLSSQTKKLKSAFRLDRGNLTRLNRFLLEDSYPKMLRKASAFSLAEEWSSLKETIIGDPAVQNARELRDFYKQVFKIFDQNLSGRLRWDYRTI